MKQAKSVCNTVIRREEREAEGFTYLYEIVMQRSEGVASFRIPLYSIRVSLTRPDGEISTAEIKEAFADLGRAIEFYDRMVKNLATPIDLMYVHEDAMYD